ncbi:MAG: class I SAM-dependent methyltransferase [Promethearchaeota archaeon]|nr:MAG: class I SAM-dependent methyltransferase [Candidatus Lokiarchaeota archaeon]
MYQEVIDLLECPDCKKSLSTTEIFKEGDEIIKGRVICECGKEWEIDSGVLNLGVDEQEDVNRWSEIIEKLGSFEKLNEMIKEKTPANQMELGKKSIYRIIEEIKETKPRYILDIATGRGRLLENLIDYLPTNAHLVCTDLSLFVLKQDRQSIKKSHPKSKVSFIACDVKELPFANRSFDTIVTFHGVTNMREVIPKALEEIKRVLKEGKEHKFLDISLLLKPDSESIKTLKEHYNERGVIGIEDFMTEKGIVKFHEKAGFSEIKMEKVGDSIARENELDLVPVEGDWFSIGIIYAIK